MLKFPKFGKAGQLLEWQGMAQNLVSKDLIMYWSNINDFNMLAICCGRKTAISPPSDLHYSRSHPLTGLFLFYRDIMYYIYRT